MGLLLLLLLLLLLTTTTTTTTTTTITTTPTASSLMPSTTPWPVSEIPVRLTLPTTTTIEEKISEYPVLLTTITQQMTTTSRATTILSSQTNPGKTESITVTISPTLLKTTAEKETPRKPRTTHMPNTTPFRSTLQQRPKNITRINTSLPSCSPAIPSSSLVRERAVPHPAGASLLCSTPV